MNLHTIDAVIIVVYFIAIIGIGLWIGTREKKNKKGYYLAGGKLTWPFIGASLFGTNISSEQFVGQAGGAFALGIAIGNPQLVGGFCYILLGLLFAPVFLRMGLYTVPEFLEKRFNPSCRTIYAVISIITFVGVRISVALYAGSLVMEEFLGIPMMLGIIILGVSAAGYTVIGGLASVVYTDAIQTVILIIGGALMLFFGLQEVGGWDVLVASADTGSFDLLRPATDMKMPWTGVISGLMIGSLFYCCNDHEVVQRVLGAKNDFHAKMGGIFAGFLKILTIFVIVVPGLIARQLFPEIEPDKAYSHMVMHILPIGISGIVLAGLMAALMSSLDSAFCAVSSVFTLDIFSKFKKDLSEKQSVNIGRFVAIIAFIIAMLWAPFIADSESGLMYIYLLKFNAYVSTPFVACFLFGILSKRVNDKGALTAIIIGSIIGLTLMITTSVPSLKVYLPNIITTNHFFHISAVLFIFSTTILFLVSYFTEKPIDEKICFIRKDKADANVENLPFYKNPIVWASICIICIIIMYLIF